MSDLIERYVHQVGRYLPGKERAEIQAELRSQIQDQLDDRYQGTPSEADVAAVLRELGDPRRMAASYSGEQYLIGPDLYPTMMMVLRRGWVIVPPVAALIHVLAGVTGSETSTLITLLLETVAGALRATAIFTGIVVLLFAILQHSGEDLDEITGRETGFDPQTLPPVDDPGEIDRVEAIARSVFLVFPVVVMLYFLRVGGLTLRFNLADPGAVIPVPIAWLIALILIVTVQIVLQVTALVRGRWSVGLWLFNMALDVAGAVGLYFVLWVPLSGLLFDRVPALAELPLMGRLPEIVLITSLVIIPFEGLVKLVKMVRQPSGEPVAYKVKTH